MHSIIPILSIIVISHEQHKQLRRCIDSILAMPISYPYEIIVSDDRSTDGSYELSQQYASQQQTDKNLLGIIALQCNSDECNPAYNSERSGYNRCNAYPYAQGKYIAFVDADDYFEEGSHVYDLQIEALEKHPECALAMSNHYYMHDGKNDAEIVKPNMELHNGEIVSATDFITKCYFHLNQAFIQRRNLYVNPCEIYGKKWVDSVITYHHLQFGPIVYVDTCGYVYVQYESSVTGVMETQNRDRDVMWNLSVYIPTLIPKWRKDFTIAYYESIRGIVRLARSGYKLSKRNYLALHSLQMWIYECFGRGLTGWDKFRLRLFLVWQRLQHKYKIYGSLGVWLTWRLLK